MGTKVNKKKQTKRRRIFLRIIGFFLFLLILFFGLLWIPAVQSYLAEKLTQYLEKKYETGITIRKLRFTPTGKIHLGQVLVRDHRQDTMIYIDQITTKWLNPWQLGKNKMLFGHTELDSVQLNMTQYAGEKNDNLNIWINKIDSLTGSQNPNSGQHFRLKINDISLNRFHYRLINQNTGPEPLYAIDDFTGEIQPLRMVGSQVEINLRQARFRDIYGLEYHDFQVDFTYMPDTMYFHHLDTRTTDSHIQADLTLSYTREQLKHFFDEVEWSGPIRLRMAATDLQKIISHYRFNPQDTVYLEGQLGGVLNEWEIKQAQWHTAGGLDFEGEMVVYELMHPDSLGVQLFADKMDLSYTALHHFLPRLTEKNIPSFIKNAGEIRSKGMFLYKPGLLETDMNTFTGIGDIRHKLKIYFGMKPAVYSGIVQLRDLDLGRLTDNKKLGPVSGQLQVNGKGFNRHDTHTYLQGKLSRLHYNGYDYSAIRVSGQLTKGKFNGLLKVHDPHFQMDFTGLVLFGARTNVFSFTSDIRHADLYKTHWVPNDTLALFQGQIKMNMQGKSWEDMVGELNLSHVHYTNSKDRYNLKFLHLNAETLPNGKRRISIRSDKAVNGYLQGDFVITRLGKVAAYALGTLLPRYKPDHPVKDNVRFSLLFDSNLLKILIPGLQNVTQTSLKGQIDALHNYVHAELKSDSLTYNDVKFTRTQVVLDNQNFIYNLYAKVDTIKSGNYYIYKFRTIHLNINDTVYVKTKATGGEHHRDTLDLALYYLEKEPGKWESGLLPSTLSYHHTRWEADPSLFAEKIFLDIQKDSLSIHDITFMSGEKKISFNGYNTPENRHITADIQNLDLQDLGPVIDPFTWQGRLNGQIVSGRKEKSVFYNGRFDIMNFQLNQTLLGHWKGDFQTLQNRVMFIRTEGTKDDKQIFSASGYIDTQKNDLDINAVVSSFPVNFLSPFLEDIFDRIRGNVTGHFRLTGHIAAPHYQGALAMFGVGMRVKELNTDYLFDDNAQLIIQDDKFVFPGNAFTDTKYHTRGMLKGHIGFYQFKHWSFDLHIQGDNLLALDTPYSDESTYYGTAFVKGGASITGDLNKIKIDAAIKSNPGTRLYIQLIDVETVGEDNFIHFYTQNQYRQHLKKQSKGPSRTYEGLELNMNLDINKNADIEIVMDPEFGSVLHAKGEGVIVMEINTLGKFNMWGTYQVEEGYYDFKYAGIIEKKFEVESGSTIVWNGDPYHAQLNIRAIYHIPAADVTPLLRDAVSVQQKVPVDVIINLTGDLMKPKIDFQIRLPQANSLIRSQVEYALSDPDRRILQVLSLLYSKSFISEEVLRFSNRAAVEGNLSERVLSVFNALLENDFFNVQLNYVPGQENPETNIKTDTQVGMTIQTKVNKRIYINGKVVMPVGRYTATSVAGDIEAVMWLNKEGTLQFRLYNKRTPIEYAGQKEGYTQGAGVRFHVEFDTFKELLKRMGFRVETE